MENKTKNKKDTVSYRNKHYIAIAAVICITVAQAFSLEGIWKILIYAGFAFVVGALVGTYEEKDELTNATLLKATEFTFFIVLGTLFISAIVVENFEGITNTTQLAIDLLYYILFGSVAVRSLIFLILDRTPKSEYDEDEEFEEEVEEVDEVEEAPALVEEEIPAIEEKEEKPETIDIEKLKEELKAQLMEELKEELKNDSKTEEVIEEAVEEVVEETVGEVIEETDEEIVEEIPEEVTETEEEKPKSKAVKNKNARKS